MQPNGGICRVTRRWSIEARERSARGTRLGAFGRGLFVAVTHKGAATSDLYLLAFYSQSFQHSE